MKPPSRSPLLLAALVGAAIAGQQPSPPAAVYTAAQAQGGRTAYNAACEACHGNNLEGSGDAPALAGGAFRLQWGSRIVSDQGFPVTISVDGRQYIAVMTGLGGGSPRNVPAAIAPESTVPQTGQALSVFGLP